MLYATGGNMTGSGTNADPFLVVDYADLENIGKYIYTNSSVYRLSNDIDASSSATENSGLGFSPIGSVNMPFTGTLHGAGHIITNLTIKLSADTIGLFGYTSSAIIDSLSVIDAYIVGNNCVGEIVGSMKNGTMSNCSSSGSVIGICAGGIVGYNSGSVARCYSSGKVQSGGGAVGYNNGTIADCYATGNVSGSGIYVGGFGGYNAGTIDSCYSTGSVSNGTYVGGVLGYNTGTVTNSYSIGSISGDYYVGGVAGLNYSGTINNCYATGNVSGDSYVGGVVGQNARKVTNCNSTGNVTGSGTYIGGVAGQNYYSGIINNCNTAGTVTGSGNYVGGIAGQNKYTVSNCWARGSVTGNEAYVGGVVGQNDDTVVNCNATGNIDGALYIGGIVGQNGSIVTNCNATGSVTGTGNYVGGFGGYNAGTISICYETGKVSGGGYVGGFGGYNAGTITICYESGNVSSSGIYAGGFDGYNCGTINNCYTTGSVLGISYVGGFGGYLYSGTISNCFEIGYVAGSNKLGGFLGDNGNGVISACYWNTQTSGQINGAYNYNGPGSGIGLTTVQMEQSANYSGWAFNTMWTIRTDSTYPGLRKMVNAPFAFADTFSTGNTFALSKLLLNDCALDTGRNNLVLKVISASAGITDSVSILTFPSGIATGTISTVQYRVGEVRTAIGDTLWGNIATSFIIDSTSISSIMVDNMTDTTSAFGRFKGQIASASPGTYQVIYGTDSTKLTSSTNPKLFTTGITSVCDTVPSIGSGIFRYKFVATNRVGTDTSSMGKLVILIGTSVADHGKDGLVPKKLTLANYPNPFNPTTTIQFSVEKDGRAIVKMFDILGREVATLYDNIAKSGQYYTATFNGLQYSSGVYLYMIESNNQRVVKKMLMLK